VKKESRSFSGLIKVCEEGDLILAKCISMQNMTDKIWLQFQLCEAKEVERRVVQMEESSVSGPQTCSISLSQHDDGRIESSS